MFSKTNKKTPADNKPVPVPAPPSIISRDLKIVGDLHSDGEIQIDGKVSGDIRTRILIVGETAKIRGEIVAETIHVLGRVDGQIKAKTVKLADTAHVVGDILHEDLSIETGAFLEGHCKRMIIPDDVHKTEKPMATADVDKSVDVNKPKMPGALKPAPATVK
ncbi:MAG: polymer-forming cytoskeletal protein [Rhodospirillales bacterium]